MEPSRAGRRYAIVEPPLSARDYDVPVGWWGWNWDPPIPMSITEIVGAGNMDARAAALCGMAIEAHGSLLIEERARVGQNPRQFVVSEGQFLALTGAMSGLPSRMRVARLD